MCPFILVYNIYIDGNRQFLKGDVTQILKMPSFFKLTKDLSLPETLWSLKLRKIFIPLSLSTHHVLKSRVQVIT